MNIEGRNRPSWLRRLCAYFMRDVMPSAISEINSPMVRKVKQGRQVTMKLQSKKKHTIRYMS